MNSTETTKIQISDSVPCGILLALSGGCMDAYSYLHRGHVFANAQTGNMLLFGVNLANSDFPSAFKYLWPILCFIAGIILANIISAQKKFLYNHWRQIAVAFEAIILIIVAFLPQESNAVANMLTSFACGIQLESFRIIHDNQVATTMCIGNLRSGVTSLSQYIVTRDKIFLKRVFLYFGIIASFIIGAIVESLLINVIGGYAILLSPVLLIIVSVLLYHEPLTYDGSNYI